MVKMKRKKLAEYSTAEDFYEAVFVVEKTIRKGQFFFVRSPHRRRHEWPEMLQLRIVLKCLRAVEANLPTANDDERRIKGVVRESFTELAGAHYSLGWLIRELDELAERKQAGEIEAKEEILQFFSRFWRKLVNWPPK